MLLRLLTCFKWLSSAVADAVIVVVAWRRVVTDDGVGPVVVDVQDSDVVVVAFVVRLKSEMTLPSSSFRFDSRCSISVQRTWHRKKKEGGERDGRGEVQADETEAL